MQLLDDGEDAENIYGTLKIQHHIQHPDPIKIDGIEYHIQNEDLELDLKVGEYIISFNRRVKIDEYETVEIGFYTKVLT